MNSTFYHSITDTDTVDPPGLLIITIVLITFFIYFFAKSICIKYVIAYINEC